VKQQRSEQQWQDGQGHRQRALDAYRNAQLHGNLGEASTQWLEQRIGQLTH
jgi:MSHA biogenesis protein MshN